MDILITFPGISKTCLISFVCRLSLIGVAVPSFVLSPLVRSCFLLKMAEKFMDNLLAMLETQTFIARNVWRGKLEANFHTQFSLYCKYCMT